MYIQIMKQTKNEAVKEAQRLFKCQNTIKDKQKNRKKKANLCRFSNSPPFDSQLMDHFSTFMPSQRAVLGAGSVQGANY